MQSPLNPLFSSIEPRSASSSRAEVAISDFTSGSSARYLNGDFRTPPLPARVLEAVNLLVLSYQPSVVG